MMGSQIVEQQDIHPHLHGFVNSRLTAIEKGQGIDWITAEASLSI